MLNVVTITGPSGSGKSTTVRSMLDLSDGDTVFRPVLVPKYTTRPPRRDDSGEVICVRRIPPECDLEYVHCDMQYGLELKKIREIVQSDRSPLVILNDVRAVEHVRDIFGELVRSIFVYRESPSLDLYHELATKRGVTDQEEPIRRFRAAQMLHRVYAENIDLFDHVLLNIGTREDLDAQVRQIIESLKMLPRAVFSDCMKTWRNFRGA